MSEELARRKEDKLTGSHVSYYLSVIEPSVSGEDKPITVENEDVIEYFDMRFSEGTVFKSITRMCKLRQDLGKPGSTKKYEAEKTVYYSDRTLAVMNCILKKLGLFGRILEAFLVLVKGYTPNTIKHIRINIPDPKRLKPYSFIIGDYITSLDATGSERKALLYLFTLCYYRQRWFTPKLTLVHLADRLQVYSHLVHKTVIESQSNE